MRLFVLCCMIVAIAGCLVAAAVFAADSEAKKPNLGKLRHVVIFKFKDGTTPEQIKEIRMPSAPAGADSRSSRLRVGHQQQPGEPWARLYPLLFLDLPRRGGPGGLPAASRPQGVRQVAAPVPGKGAGARLRGARLSRDQRRLSVGSGHSVRGRLAGGLARRVGTPQHAAGKPTG